MQNKKCNLIDHEEAKALFGTKIKIREISSNIEFEAFVTDYCFPDQKGLIACFDKKVAQSLNNKDFGPADRNPESMVEMDFRDIYHGKDFELVYNYLH